MLQHRHPHLPATAGDVADILGTPEDSRIETIVATGATAREVWQAYTSMDPDMLFELGRPLSGAAAQVYDILLSHDHDGGGGDED